MLILSHHQNNKMNSMTTFTWCKRGILLSIVVRYDHDSGICGGGGHHFFVYPKEWVITFLVLTKGGSCVFARCFAGSYRYEVAKL